MEKDKPALDSPLPRFNMSAITRRSRVHWTRITAVLILVSVFLLYRNKRGVHSTSAYYTSGRHSSSTSTSAPRPLMTIADPPAGFNAFPVTGFVNSGKPGKIACDSLHHEGEMYAEHNFVIEDDIQHIAASLKHHPIVDYSGQDKSLSHHEVVEKTWLRMAQSSVWLERFGVYLTVTRVVHYTKGVRQWPVMSFLRGQIHDKDWNELRDYDIFWRGDVIRFPRVFDIPAPYVVGGGFYGPEDPRIIIEQGNPDAEPVIVFNMMANIEPLYRAMFVMRPFTNDTTMLNIAGIKRSATEKNWMPFFYSENPGVSEWPSHYIHFFYQFKPLRVLKCHLLNGWCDFVYTQEIPDSFKSIHNDTGGVMRGGSNFYPLSRHDGVQSYIAFPKTNIGMGCGDRSYRPTLMLFTAASPNHFHIDYMSESIDFANEAMTEQALADPCGEGRIMMANSIANWDRNVDILTLTYTVDDITTQVIRLHGLEALISTIPDRSRMSPATHETLASSGPNLYDLQWSTVSLDIQACTIESAMNYTLARTSQVNGTDLRKIREEKEKKLLEEERKIKELTRIKLEEARVAEEKREKEEATAKAKEVEEEAKKRKEKEIEDKVQEAVDKIQRERLREKSRKGIAGYGDGRPPRDEDDLRDTKDTKDAKKAETHQ